jgi:hypothetical protein
MAKRMRTYRGYNIYECEWAGNPLGVRDQLYRYDHGGRWLVQTYHEPTGIPWADERCPHYWTLAEAKEAIRVTSPSRI